MRRTIQFALALCVIYLLIVAFNTKVRNNVWRAYVVALKSDLRNAAEAQARWADSTGGFSADLARLEAFEPSPHVTVGVEEYTRDAIRLRATHDRFSPAVGCGISVDRAPPGPATTGTVYCDRFTNWLGLPRTAP